jgi:hypothetical protein
MLIYRRHPRVYYTLALEALKEEASISRLYGGIHYRSDLEMGKAHGKRIGGYTVSFARASMEPICPSTPGQRFV